MTKIFRLFEDHTLYPNEDNDGIFRSPVRILKTSNELLDAPEARLLELPDTLDYTATNPDRLSDNDFPMTNNFITIVSQRIIDAIGDGIEWKLM